MLTCRLVSCSLVIPHHVHLASCIMLVRHPVSLSLSLCVMLVHGQNLEDSTEMKDHDVYDVCLTRDEIQECVDTVNTVVNREIAMAKCEWGEGVRGVGGV